MRLLLDTNVWLDFFLDRSVLHDHAGLLITEAHRRDAALFAAAMSVRDVYYQVGQELKRMQREDGGEVTEPFARAIDEVAWSCVRGMRKQAIIVGSDDADVVEALVMRAQHDDYEDNLIASAFARARADYLVTSDKQLLRHQVVSTLTIEEAVDRLTAH